MVERKPSVWETYNGQLVTLRRQGNTLQAIGDTVGVTKERIRQVLAARYGRVEVELLPEAGAARVIGCGSWQLAKLREGGITHPVRLGHWFWLYDRDEIEKATLTLQLQKSCPHCGKPLPLGKRGKYCPECSKERIRYHYPFLSEEARKRATQACVRWGKKHPERCREINKRAAEKYLVKKRRERLSAIEQ